MKNSSTLALSELHVRHAFTEIVRHVLAAGWSVAYGGDFRRRGYTTALLDLVRTYERTVLSGPDHFTCYLAWPIWTEPYRRRPSRSRQHRHDCTGPRSVGAPASLAPVPDRSPVERWWNALALSAMRKRMTRDVGALVVVGGRVSGQQGFYPGVVEEASLALASDVPLYRGRRLRWLRTADRPLSFDGEQPAELSIDYQRAAHSSGTPTSLRARSTQTSRLTSATSSPSFPRGGLAGLNNGLDTSDNRLASRNRQRRRTDRPDPSRVVQTRRRHRSVK